MNRTGKSKRVRGLRSGSKRKPAIFDWAMKLKIGGGFTAFALVMYGSAIYRGHLSQQREFDWLIKTWKGQYHLSDEQAARIRRLEEDFHGNGNVLTQPSHTLEEQIDHEPALSRVMNPEDAARFLADREQNAKTRQRPVRAHAH